MSSEWSGCFHENKLAECIADLFYEPPDYDELCFYCVEGTCCPNHEIPQPRHQKEGTNAVSIDYVLNEIFGLQNDSWQYANYKIEVSEEKKAAAKNQQKFAEKRSVSNDHITERHVLVTFPLLPSAIPFSHLLDGEESRFPKDFYDVARMHAYLSA
ncbi:unnamed protein product [Acanthocheilonema viteae]|uniref:Uncharacterized protein n=1 Tax=Acanthocheilonema viteae TaxID=6277 RepID=A0A498S6M1_ACAVI|nr:unnamed protein product [Acanthocheilonema viteae]